MKIIKKQCNLFLNNKITSYKFVLFKNRFSNEIQNYIHLYFIELSLYKCYHHSQNLERDKSIRKMENILNKINQIRMKNWGYK